MRILHLVFLMLPMLAAAVYAGDAGPEAAAEAKKTISGAVKATEAKDGKAKASPAPQKAAQPTESEEKKGDVFVLPDMGWRDVFTDPRDIGKGDAGIDAGRPRFETGEEEIEKTWNDAVAELTVEMIIGWENDLAAIIAGDTVRSGDMIVGDKLKFVVQKITKDVVYLRCISEEEKFSSLNGLVTKRNIIF